MTFQPLKGRFDISFKKFAADVLICFLYLLFISSAFAAFSGYSLRSAWMADLKVTEASPVDPEVKLNSDIIYLQREHNLLSEADNVEMALSVLNENLGEYNEEQRNVAAQTQAARDRIYVLANLMRFELNSAKSSLEQTERDRLDVLLGENFDENFAKFLEVSELLDVVLKKRLDEFPELTALRQEIVQKFAELDELKGQGEEVQEGIRSVNEQWLRLSSKQEKVKAELKSIADENSISDISRSRFIALSMVGGLNLDILRQLVGFPTIFLTLIVTLAAGGMGALVSMTRSFKKNDLPRSVVWLQLGEGIVAALAIFLLSGTGLIALTSGNSGPATQAMSPYTVAFLAFVSGFLADDAFSAIMRSGKKFFEGFSPPE